MLTSDWSQIRGDKEKREPESVVSAEVSQRLAWIQTHTKRAALLIKHYCSVK